MVFGKFKKSKNPTVTWGLVRYWQKKYGTAHGTIQCTPSITGTQEVDALLRKFGRVDLMYLMTPHRI